MAMFDAEKAIGWNLPSLQELYASRTLRCAGKVVGGPSYPEQNHLQADGWGPSGLINK